MKRLLSIILLLASLGAFAQEIGDTITIPTFNYTQTYGVNQWSPGIRDTVIDFSTLPNVSFERVIMSYNMRCKDAKVSNGNNRDRGCGEWDISCNTYFHDSSRIDSVSYTHPNYIVSGFNGTSFDYTSQPLYDYYRFKQNNVVVNQINSESAFNLFTTALDTNHQFDGTEKSGKIFVLYTAAELTNAGFTAGEIDGIKLNALNTGKINFLKINVKGVAYDTLSPNNIETDQFTQVFFSNYEFVQGENRIQFKRSFDWNGTDNLLFEFTYNNSVATNAVQLEASKSNLSMAAHSNYSVSLSNNAHYEIPTKSLESISEEITVSMWVNGDNAQPVNNSIIFAEGPEGERALNLHLPWGNGNVYFDCGANGGDYDRINKEAKAVDYKNAWNHWAFTKNTTTGEMKIYLNGTLWHSATGKTRTIDIEKMILGSHLNLSNQYKGKIKELRFWNKALDEQTIANYMNVKVDAKHPNYTNLVAYYPFSSGNGNIEVNQADTSEKAIGTETITWQGQISDELDRFFSMGNTRPNITLLQGDYDTTVVGAIVFDSALVNPRTVDAYEIIRNPGSLKDDEVNKTSTKLLWKANPQIIYSGYSSTKYDEIPVTAEGVYEISELDYFRRWPAKVEIMSFVTPYGIGLDLGKNGKTWYFDVTDYLPIFTGQKRLTMEHGGQWMEDMDIRLHFIVGTPPRDVIDFDQIWRVQRVGYASINSNRYFPPRTLELDQNGEYFEIRSVITGHGQEGEFTPRDHHLFVDGDRKFTWEVWTECAENPVYPQGGTWVYDRAGWCPGAPSDMQRSIITPYVQAGGQVEIDYDVEVASGTSNYFGNHQLITYGKANHQVDARLMDVKTPSKKIVYGRYNAICHAPTIIIQNTGSEPLTSATIKYWINDAEEPMVKEWTGNLAFLESEEVTLNSLPSFWKEADEEINVFHAEITQANGQTDEYAPNNIYHSEFNLPDVLPSDFKVLFRTNNFPAENKLEITDYQGNVVFSLENLTANTTYNEDVSLGLGCYTLNVYDYDDDGISWWANNDGNGLLTLREANNRIIKNFEPDFGDNIRYNFTIDYPLSYDDVNTFGLNLYPNPANDFINIEVEGRSEEAIVQVYDINGKLIIDNTVQLKQGFVNVQLPISNLADGVYYVNVIDGDKVYTQKFSKG
jgi:hypothetical protein